MESPSLAAGGAVNVPTAPVTSAPPTPATIITAYPSPHLKKVLRSYQSAASSSLSGPNGILSAAAGHHPGDPLVYYAYSNLPLPVVVTSPLAGKTSAAGRLVVKDEPVEEQHLPHSPYYTQHCSQQPSAESVGKTCWPIGAGSVDEFKVWKLKRPAFPSSPSITTVAKVPS